MFHYFVLIWDTWLQYVVISVWVYIIFYKSNAGKFFLFCLIMYSSDCVIV